MPCRKDDFKRRRTKLIKRTLVWLEARMTLVLVVKYSRTPDEPQPMCEGALLVEKQLLESTQLEGAELPRERRRMGYQ